jgi:hypothetical protein
MMNMESDISQENNCFTYLYINKGILKEVYTVTPLEMAIVIVVAVVVGIIMFILGQNKERSMYAKTVGSAEEKSREIIDDAIRTAENKKREALLEAKEEALKAKNDLDKELKDRRKEVTELERRILKREESSEKKAVSLERKESELLKKEEGLEGREKEIEQIQKQKLVELERVSGLTKDQAKQELLHSVEDSIKHDTALIIREYDARAKEEAEKTAREYIVEAIQRCAADQVTESTVSVVQLPNDEMKGRIIGREGRNIRTLEQLTGVELIIDDTPEAVVLSGFDPVRREVARIALEKLIVDGRIHPTRIEEVVEKSRKEVNDTIKEEGESATLELGLHGIHPELVFLLGRMKFRTSFGQNALQHSMEVAQISGLLAQELGLDTRLAKRAGLLHDIGKAIDHEVEGSHVDLGIELCQKYHEPEVVINAVASHHGGTEPSSMISFIVAAADAISAARPGARRKSLETYTNRLKELEEIANSYQGVEKSFAVQAGREVRIMVVPEEVSDDDMTIMARNISKQIQDQMQYPGVIKVNIIRESRAVDYAK